MPNAKGQLFEEDRVGNHREEYKHHGLEPFGTKRGQGGDATKEILKSESSCVKPCQEQLGGGVKMDKQGIYGTTCQSCMVETEAREGAQVNKLPSLTFHVMGLTEILRLR